MNNIIDANLQKLSQKEKVMHTQSKTEIRSHYLHYL